MVYLVIILVILVLGAAAFLAFGGGGIRAMRQRQEARVDEAVSGRVESLTYEVPAVPLPWIGGLGAIEVASTHSERIDPFRDGLAGAAECPP